VFDDLEGLWDVLIARPFLAQKRPLKTVYTLIRLAVNYFLVSNFLGEHCVIYLPIETELAKYALSMSVSNFQNQFGLATGVVDNVEFWVVIRVAKKGQYRVVVGRLKGEVLRVC